VFILSLVFVNLLILEFNHGLIVVSYVSKLLLHDQVLGVIAFFSKAFVLGSPFPCLYYQIAYLRRFSNCSYWI
jgi:hypothetical protein